MLVAWLQTKISWAISKYWQCYMVKWQNWNILLWGFFFVTQFSLERFEKVLIMWEEQKRRNSNVVKGKGSRHKQEQKAWKGLPTLKHTHTSTGQTDGLLTLCRSNLSLLSPDLIVDHQCDSLRMAGATALPIVQHTTHRLKETERRQMDWEGDRINCFQTPSCEIYDTSWNVFFLIHHTAVCPHVLSMRCSNGEMTGHISVAWCVTVIWWLYQ